jgi:hypothetical protein
MAFLTDFFTKTYIYVELHHLNTIGLDGIVLFIFGPFLLFCIIFSFSFKNEFFLKMDNWFNDCFNSFFELLNWMFYFLTGIWCWILFMSFKNTSKLMPSGISTSLEYNLVLPFLFLFLVIVYEIVLVFLWKSLTTFLEKNPEYTSLINFKKTLENWDSIDSWILVDEDEGGIVVDRHAFLSSFVCFIWVCVGCVLFYLLTVSFFGTGIDVDFQKTLW